MLPVLDRDGRRKEEEVARESVLSKVFLLYASMILRRILNRVGH